MRPDDVPDQPAAGLGPVELLALLHPNRAGGPHLAQLALAPLVAAGAVAVERTPKRSRRGHGEDVRLRVTGRPAPGPSGAYRAALDALTAKPVPDRGLAPMDAAIRLQRALGPDYGRLLRDHARPLLVERGLLERHERRRLGLFRSVRYVHTPAGEQAHAALAAWVREADRVPAVLKEGVPAAAAFAARLGVAVLLSDAARPHVGRLAEEARRMGLSNPTAAPALAGYEGADAMGWTVGLGGLGDADSGGLWDAMGDLGGFDAGGADGGGGDGGGGGGD